MNLYISKTEGSFYGHLMGVGKQARAVVFGGWVRMAVTLGPKCSFHCELYSCGKAHYIVCTALTKVTEARLVVKATVWLLCRNTLWRGWQYTEPPALPALSMLLECPAGICLYSSLYLRISADNFKRMYNSS